MKPIRALLFLAGLLTPTLDASVVLLEPQAGVNHPASAAPLFRWDPVATATDYKLTVCQATGCAGSGQVFQVTLTGTSHAQQLAPGARTSSTSRRGTARRCSAPPSTVASGSTISA